MSKKTAKYNPYLPGFQHLFRGRNNLSTKEQIRRNIQDIKKKQLWDFQNLFSNWIPARLLRNEEGNTRNRIFTVELTFWAYMNQIFIHCASCAETVKKVQSWMLLKNITTLPSSNTSAYCQARKRFPVKILNKVNSHLVSLFLKKDKGEKSLQNRSVKIVDGTSVSMADTPDNQKKYPQSSGTKPGCGFPQINIAAIFSLNTGAMLGYKYGNKNISERSLWRKLWTILKCGDIILGDRGFGSYAEMALLLQKGVDSVVRLHGQREKNLKQCKGKKIGKKDCLFTWKKPKGKGNTWTEKQWLKVPDFLTIRIIEAKVIHRGFRSQKILISTTLLDPEKYPAESIAELYLKRWQIEVFYRDIKTTMGMEVLSSKTAKMIEKELEMYSICYNLLRAIMLDAANLHHIPILRISFSHTVYQLNNWLHLFMQPNLSQNKLYKWMKSFYEKLVENLVPKRPGRNEPRAVKRRPKNYRLLTKPREQMIIDCHRNNPARKNSFYALT